MVGGIAPYSAAFESSSVTPVNGVKSSMVTLNYPRHDTMDWAGGGDPVLINRPTATLQFSYIFSQGINEQALGFVFNGSIPALSNLNNERNYYVLVNQGNIDLIGYSGANNFVMSLGNGVITKYEMKASVSQPTLCSVSVDCLNLLIQGTGTGHILPSIYKQSGLASTGQYQLPPFSQNTVNATESLPSNIVLSMNTGAAIGAILSGNLACPLQNFSVSIDLPRMPSQNLGWAYASTRAIKWPVIISIHADAYLNSMQLDNLNRFGCPDSGWNFNVGFLNSGGAIELTSFSFVNAKLDNQSITAGIGGYNKVSMDWSAHIYDINRTSGNAANFYINYPQTAYNSIIFSGANWISGVGEPSSVLNLNKYVYLSIIQGAAFLSGNIVVMNNETANTVVLQANVSGSTEIEQIVATIQ
jgi:hypothetical protein